MEEQHLENPQGVILDHWGTWMLLPGAMLPGVFTHAAATAASLTNLAQFSAGIVFVTGGTIAVGLPTPLDTISPAAACQPRGTKPSPFLSGNYISSHYNEILSVIKFQSEQADFLICRDFISLWECPLPRLRIYS